MSEKDFSTREGDIWKLYPDATSETIGFLRASYESIGKDPRIHSGHTEAKKKIAFEALQEGMVFSGVVRNVVAFGAFVDIGLKNDGLVHVSELADRYVKNPMDVVSVGQSVKVRITKIDTEGKKVQLSMRGV